MLVLIPVMILLLVFSWALFLQLADAAEETRAEWKRTHEKPMFDNGLSWWEADRIACRVLREDRKRGKRKWHYGMR